MQSKVWRVGEKYQLITIRVTAKMSREKLLSEITQAFAIRKLQTNAWETRRARLVPEPSHVDDVAAQRVMND